MLRKDGIQMLVPATWQVLGAGAIPTTPNKDFVEGRLEAVKADMSELLAAGMQPPGVLFRAEGGTSSGGTAGVIVGVFDNGSADPIPSIRESLAKLTPAVGIDSVNIAGSEGLRTAPAAGDTSVGESFVVYDYWARVPKGSTSFALLRFWCSGPANADDELLFDNMVGSLVFHDPASWSGPLRFVTVGACEAPNSEEAAETKGRFRYAGWRLGTVFHTKMVPPKQIELATQMGARARDMVLLLGVFVAWIAVTLLSIGFVGPIFLLGGFSMAGFMPRVRKSGPKAAVGLAVFLGALTAFGAVTS